MKFDNKLISGQFIKRYKRFFVDIKIKNKVVTAHCPNTGSMFGLLKKGNRVWLSKSNNPKRKLKYTLQIIEDQKSKVGVNTHLTNKIVLHALKNNLIKVKEPNIAAVSVGRNHYGHPTTECRNYYCKNGFKWMSTMTLEKNVEFEI